MSMIISSLFGWRKEDILHSALRQSRKSFSILRIHVKHFAYARKAFCAKA